MRAVVQRVRWARVKVEDEVVGEINGGLLVLLGAGKGDLEQDAEYLANKVTNLRIFEDDDQNMNRSLLDEGGSMLVVSQFTLYGDCRKGRRPSFVAALEPGEAERLCELFVARCASQGVKVETGRFRAMMDVELCNAGPVTMLVDSQKQF
jgi:D-tyrosyl-tRNA(Tyr) deacylase